jgi:prolipoprotein diacylglyceryltransferase
LFTVTSINAFLDALPRPRLQRLGRDVPTYRALGVAGYYGALLLILAGGLLTGRSLLVLAILALVSGVSFFVYAHVRRWITGQERIVLLEHVWFALAASAAVLWILHEPVAAYLDIESVGICLFLAAGRAGCTLVGCCYGQPASIGIAYGEAAALDGFPRDLVGVRLFPVQTVEMVGLLVIGTGGMFALRYAHPGTVVVWFLAAYAILRFGLEGIRFDPRPHLLGLSQARWMAMIEVGAILWLSDGHSLKGLRVEVAVALAVASLTGLTLRYAFNWHRRILKKTHLAELRGVVTTELSAHPVVRVTSAGVNIAASRTGAAFGSEAHVSISLADDRRDLELLCQLAASAFPAVSPFAVHASGGKVLHLVLSIPLELHEEDLKAVALRGRALYATVLRQMQRGEVSVTVPPNNGAPPRSRSRPWYFTVAATHRG